MNESVYFIGLGGSGMLPLARLAHLRGCRVGGSDPRLASLSDSFADWEVSTDPRPELLKRYDKIVYSSAIPADHPERTQAGSRALHRMDFLLEVARAYPVQMAVAGTHGKTGTTSLLGWMLRGLGLDPAILVGGAPLYLEGGVCAGDGRIMVYETDESDASFLKSEAQYRLCLNVDRDHMETYGDLNILRAAFARFGSAARSLVVNSLDAGLSGISWQAERTVFYGGEESDYPASWKGDDLFYRGELIERPGRELALNALGALALVKELVARKPDLIATDFDLDRALLQAIASFPGVSRRMEFIGRMGGVDVYDDYGHHPTEIAAVIAALRRKTSSRICVFFQPHRFTRTRDLFREFARSLALADFVFLLPLYSAGEEPLPGVDSGLIADHLPPERSGGVVSFEDLGAELLPDGGQGYVILALGAGSISESFRKLLNK